MQVRTRDELEDLLARRIIGGSLASGALLPSERELSSEYGLSRSMVREALRTLAERRLIDVVPGRGSFARAPTIEVAAERLVEVLTPRHITARALIEARQMVETTAASLAAQRASPEAIAAIDDTMGRLHRDATLGDQVRADYAFHLAVVRAAGNPLVETTFVAIRPYTLELMVRSLTDDGLSRESLPLHGAIRDAIAGRDASAAAAAMTEHLGVGLRYYGLDLDRSLESVSRRSLDMAREPGPGLEELLREVGAAEE